MEDGRILDPRCDHRYGRESVGPMSGKWNH